MNIFTRRKIRDDAARMQAMRDAGVDNWEGYDFAMEIYREGLPKQ